MTDTTQGETGGKRARVSQRDFITATGDVVDRMEQAEGARYTLVGAGRSYDYVVGKNTTADKFWAVFGYLTKVGNVANTVLNDKDDPGSFEDAATAIEAFLEQVEGGVWREAGEGAGRGPKYDNGILAEALVALLGQSAKGDAGYYQAKLDDPKGEIDSANKGYRNKVVARDDVKARYWQIASERGMAKPEAAPAESLA